MLLGSSVITMVRLLESLALLLSVGLSTLQAQERVQGVTSPLSGRRCSVLSVEKTTSASVTRCPGVGGFRLLVADDDNRASLTG